MMDLRHALGYVARCAVAVQVLEGADPRETVGL
jgi:hypothetical protein